MDKTNASAATPALPAEQTQPQAWPCRDIGRAVVIDDTALFRQGMLQTLQNIKTLDVVESLDPEDLLMLGASMREPDLLVFGIAADLRSSLRVLRNINEMLVPKRLLILSDNMWLHAPVHARPGISHVLPRSVSLATFEQVVCTMLAIEVDELMA